MVWRGLSDYVISSGRGDGGLNLSPRKKALSIFRMPLPIELKQKFAIFATCRISNLQIVLDSSQYFGNSNL